MIKMKAPETHSGMTHAGKVYAPDKQGVVEIPDELVPVALSHGLTHFSEEAEEVPAPKSKLKLAKSQDA